MLTPDIVTPCCEAPVFIETRWVGHLGGIQPDGLSCSAYGCYNVWDVAGVADSDNKDKW